MGHHHHHGHHHSSGGHPHDHHDHHGHRDPSQESHHESQEHADGPSETDKMVKLVEHWAHHNEEHAKSYRTWAERARHMGLGEIGRVLEKVAAETLAQNTHFEKILGLLQGEAKE